MDNILDDSLVKKAWLAGTNPPEFSRQNTKRSIKSISVTNLCNNITDRINVDTFDEEHRLPLHMSSNLILGAARIYEQKVDALLEDTAKLLTSTENTRNQRLSPHRLPYKNEDKHQGQSNDDFIQQLLDAHDNFGRLSVAPSVSSISDCTLAEPRDITLPEFDDIPMEQEFENNDDFGTVSSRETNELADWLSVGLVRADGSVGPRIKIISEEIFPPTPKLAELPSSLRLEESRDPSFNKATTSTPYAGIQPIPNPDFEAPSKIEEKVHHQNERYPRKRKNKLIIDAKIENTNEFMANLFQTTADTQRCQKPKSDATPTKCIKSANSLISTLAMRDHNISTCNVNFQSPNNIPLWENIFGESYDELTEIPRLTSTGPDLNDPSVNLADRHSRFHTVRNAILNSTDGLEKQWGGAMSLDVLGDNVKTHDQLSENAKSLHIIRSSNRRAEWSTEAIMRKLEILWKRNEIVTLNDLCGTTIKRIDVAYTFSQLLELGKLKWIGLVRDETTYNIKQIKKGVNHVSYLNRLNY